MNALDQLIGATTSAEKQAALVEWRAIYGEPLKFVAEGKLSEFVCQTIPGNRCRDFLRAYQRMRQQFCERLASAPDSIDSYFAGPETQFHLAVLMMAQELSNGLASARDILEEMLLSDSEMKHVASVLFERMGEDAWPSFERICDALAK